MNRDLSGEGVLVEGEDAEVQQEQPDEDLRALRAEAIDLRSKVDLFSTEGWRLLVSEITAAREEQYRNLAKLTANTMEAVSIIRGQIITQEFLLTYESVTRARLSEVQQALQRAEAENTQEA